MSIKKSDGIERKNMNKISANFYLDVGENIIPLKWIRYDGSPWWPGITSLNDWKLEKHFFDSKTSEEYMDRYDTLIQNYIECEDYNDDDIKQASFKVDYFNYTFINGSVYISIDGYPWVDAKFFKFIIDEPNIIPSIYSCYEKTFSLRLIRKDIREVRWFF